MRSILFAALLVTVVLLVPVLPLAFLGQDQVAAWLQAERSPGLQLALIVAALATDIFLPVPSSAVSTYAGGSGLGIWPATLASWVGMTLGAVLGFGLARLFGERFAARLAGRHDLERISLLSRRYGPLALLFTRPLPILAEACVLLMGATRLSWRRFLVPVAAANLVISLTYAACGRYFQGTDAFPIAVVASGTIPLAIALVARWLLPGVREEAKQTADG